MEAYCDIMAMTVDTRQRTIAPQVFRPYYDVDWGTVMKVLGRFDVPLWGRLTKAGITTDVQEGELLNYCSDVTYRYSGNTITVKCAFEIRMVNLPGDSGGPIYVVGPSIGLSSIEVYAYGITSGYRYLNLSGYIIPLTTIASPLDAYHLYVQYT
ncbi:hypothetical protein Pogu_1624 [Pyrobaculum oguniense TE7]|uniref:Uncharacterized protein n=1 Tax=Pyrobaculum oguniense (strain DSM 13380 / JCM 10595 / TE7) TaxID=698757 RepID=H6Q9B9_PYROT|nr:hypothetical protein Pogu_1624 [Pyrobaculum oguniense TE7]